MKQVLAAHCARLPTSVLYDEATGLLMDVASGKTLDASSVAAVEQRTDPRSFAPLLGVRLADGRGFALADVGIAFAPVFTHTGVLAELPLAVCWADFRAISTQLKLELYGAAGKPSEATVRVLMCCLAIVDGARAVGFDVGPEERELEWHLKQLERRAPGWATYRSPMHPNAQLLTDFYQGFNKLDAGPMVKAYAADATFSDPAFPNLKGSEIGDMWTMLCGRARGFSLTFRDVVADDGKGSAHWEADYLFQGGRAVHNVIDASFTFKDGKILTHVDSFDFWRWSRMALGPPGLMLGWTGFLKAKVQAQAAKALAEFRRKR